MTMRMPRTIPVGLRRQFAFGPPTRGVVAQMLASSGQVVPMPPHENSSKAAGAIRSAVNTDDVMERTHTQEKSVANSSSNASKGGIKTGRLQVVLSNRSIDRLERLKQETEAASTAEVVRRALRLLEGLIELAETSDQYRNEITRVFGDARPEAIGAEDEQNTRQRYKARLQLVLPQTSVDRLKKLKENTKAKSYAEVIRRALRVYEIVEKDGGDGGEENILVPMKLAG